MQICINQFYKQINHTPAQSTEHSARIIAAPAPPNLSVPKRRGRMKIDTAATATCIRHLKLIWFNHNVQDIGTTQPDVMKPPPPTPHQINKYTTLEYSLHRISLRK
jgi:hypothetical protein